MPVADPRSIQAFRTAKAFETWLATNHDKKTELYLRIYKKASGRPTVTHVEAVEVALCWGWIDAIRKAYDEESFLQRFTPRGRKSLWSQINRQHVARLTAAGRMTEHGAAQVEAAKADGRWDAAYAGARTMTIPEDLRQAIDDNRAARATFGTLSKQNLYALAFRLANLKTVASRQKKIAAFVDMLARGETPHPNRRTTGTR